MIKFISKYIFLIGILHIEDEDVHLKKILIKLNII